MEEREGTEVLCALGKAQNFWSECRALGNTEERTRKKVSRKTSLEEMHIELNMKGWGKKELGVD